MRWRAIVGTCLLAIAVSVTMGQQEVKEKDDDQQPQSSIARAQWQDVQNQNPENSRGYEDKTEEESEDQFEQSRRVRVRNGPKRRRRLRKRPRTTTPSTGEEESAQEEQVEEQFSVRPRWSNEDSVDYLPIDSDFRPYRRRPGKRRRRPLRKQQFLEQPDEAHENQDNIEDNYRRRRKGNRKRIKIHEENPEEPETLEGSEKTKNEEIPDFTSESYFSKTSSEQTHNRPTGRGDGINQHHSKQTGRQDENTTVVTSTRRHHIEGTRQAHQTTTARTRNEESQIHHDDFKELIKPNRHHERQRDRNKLDVNGLIEKGENKNETINKGVNNRKDKVFDRKTLFSTSHRLPQTSAIIRRRLRPKNSTLETLLPEGYNKQMPEIIPPHKLIEEMMSTRKTITEKESSEEPNYPKMPEQKMRIVVSTSTSISISPDLDERNMFPTIKEFFKVGKEPQPRTTTLATTTTSTSTTTETPDTTDKNDSLENINIEDHILDLLLTKNSSSRLAKILELRNMTLIQLLQHRERGSSQLHFSDIFDKQNNTNNENKDNGKNIEEDKSETYSQNEPNIKEDIREPRIFESLPDFDKNSILESNTRPYPTWSVIPNPDLTPMRNNHDNTFHTIKPFYTDNIEEIILIEDNNVGGFSESFNMNFANKISDGIKTFKKFPPGVKSAIIVSMGILILAIIGFLSVLISCRVRQKRSRLRAKRDVLNEQLHNEEFMNSQRSLSPVLTKNQPTQPSFTQGIHSNTSSNRHYYLWRTLRKTFQYD